MVRVNINDRCEVVLRKRGVAAIQEHYARLGLEPPVVTVGDTYAAPLWEIMVLMGSECCMGLEPPFDTFIVLHSSGDG